MERAKKRKFNEIANGKEDSKDEEEKVEKEPKKPLGKKKTTKKRKKSKKKTPMKQKIKKLKLEEGSQNLDVEVEIRQETESQALM